LSKMLRKHLFKTFLSTQVETVA